MFQIRFAVMVILISQPYDYHKISYYSIDNETKSDDDSCSDNSNSDFAPSKNYTLTTMKTKPGFIYCSK